MSYYKGQTLFQKSDGTPMVVTGVLGDDVFLSSGAKVKSSQIKFYFDETPNNASSNGMQFGAPDVSKYKNNQINESHENDQFDPDKWLTEGSIRAIQNAIYTPYNPIVDGKQPDRNGVIPTHITDVTDEIDEYELERLKQEYKNSASYNSMLETSKKVLSGSYSDYDSDEDTDWLGNPKQVKQDVTLPRKEPMLNVNGEEESAQERAERLKKERGVYNDTTQQNNLNPPIGSGDTLPRKQMNSNRVPTQNTPNEAVGSVIGKMMLKKNHQFKVNIEYTSMIPDPSFLRIAIENTDDSMDLIGELANEITDAIYNNEQMIFDMVYHQLKNHVKGKRLTVRKNARKTSSVSSAKNKLKEPLIPEKPIRKTRKSNKEETQS
jgi:hypothetical protein